MYNSGSSNPSGSNSQGHSRPGSGRRSISASQPLSGQLPPIQNGNAVAGATPTPVPQSQSHSQPPGIPIGPNMPAFDASRSPPSSKNLNHVPCKFFRQGTCQAGKACPFSHSMDPTSDQAPCKYFSKGNCKFGVKCALAHILPDGRRINRQAYNNNSHTSHLQFGRMDTGHTNHRSALHNSLLQANMIPHHSPSHSFGGQDDFPGLTSHPGGPDPNLATSILDSRYGSPRDDSALPMSPLASSQRTLGPLDATLPASFDRHEYSKFARFGPYASSVPSKFGMESPPPSLPSNTRPAVLQSLYMSAYGRGGGNGEEDNNLAADLSHSPRADTEDSLGPRVMHSSLSARRTKLLSSSYARPENMERMLGEFTRERFTTDPTVDGDSVFEEDFVPHSLQELLTPAERNRRLSRTDEEGVSNFPHSLTAPGTPGDSMNVIGSPPVGSPGGPSGWGPIVMRHKRDEDHAPISTLGHVGSPLRNSYQQGGEPSPTFRPLCRPTSGDISPFPGSPNRTSSGISALTQTLQRARLSPRSDPSGSGEVPTLSKALGSNGKQIERVVSNPQSNNGKTVAPIDEESDTQFPMEEEEYSASPRLTINFGSLGAIGRGSGLGLDVSEQQWESFGTGGAKKFH
ncbi:hypothetical protein B9Z19DRAFT_997096 [Tuber borchii]|uniref:C3H1-type domain-containing protein n=1 Tax=Tuber borchii TaxID=42251 RepID=A0A2T6ZHD1_TUBBO|nr:hypothetical protein B9Z19DRAFT_997096 [Tuber borchii]